MTAQAKEVVEEKVEKVAEVVEAAPAEAKSKAAKAKKAVHDTAQQVEHSSFAEALHNVLLAGVGAMALGKEELDDFMSKLVERGQIAEADARKMAKEVMARRKKEAKKAGNELDKRVEEITGQLDKRVEEIMGRADIPTKAQIEELSAKISALTKKVDELKKSA
jgi:poly(hydroxyalkanoate) granule-associated protein